MHTLMWEPEKFSSTSMARRRNLRSNWMLNSVPKSRLYTGRRSSRKSRRSHLSLPLKPSLNLWKVCKFRRRRSKLSFITTEMRDVGFNVRNSWNQKRKRSKQCSLSRKCGESKCHRQGPHPATTNEPKVWRVSLRIQNPCPCHEVHGTYPSLHLHIG